MSASCYNEMVFFSREYTSLFLFDYCNQIDTIVNTNLHVHTISNDTEK